MKNIKQHARFFQGLVLGLFITSALSYATVTLQTFMAGTPISAAQMNANFAAIKTKLDSLDVGYVGVLSTPVNLICGTGGSYATYPGDFTVLSLTDEHNDGNYVTNIYTIPETAIYRIYLNIKTEDNMGFTSTIDVSIDGGVSWNQETNMAGGQLIKKFSTGDKIRILAGCGTMAAGGDSTTVPSESIFAIKKY